MGRKVIWSRGKIEECIIPKLKQGMSVSAVAKYYGLSRQRVYYLLDDSGYDSKGNIKP